MLNNILDKYKTILIFIFIFLVHWLILLKGVYITALLLSDVVVYLQGGA